MIEFGTLIMGLLFVVAANVGAVLLRRYWDSAWDQRVSAPIQFILGPMIVGLSVVQFIFFGGSFGAFTGGARSILHPFVFISLCLVGIGWLFGVGLSLTAFRPKNTKRR